MLLAETEPMIRLAEKLWSVSRKESRMARTVVLKLKTSEFKILTRSLLRRTDGHRLEAARTDDLGPLQRYRLVALV